jgi:sugar-specific transcriptional regulator TrmB/DNA-binding CsgD family transcriptional regulator
MSEPGIDGLRSIGIGVAEQAAYEMLLDRPEAGTAELAQAWDRPEVLGGVLARLQAAGLIRLVPGPPSRYVAVPPQIALEALVLEEEQRLRAARGHARRLAELYRDHALDSEPASLVEVVTGQRALRQRLGQLQRGARRQIRCLDKAPSDHRPRTPLLDLALVPDQVDVRIVYDRASVEEDRTRPGDPRAGEQARVLPDLPMRTLIVDDTCAALPLSDEPGRTEAAFVVHRSALLHALGDLFEGLWQRAIPLDLPGPGGMASRSRTIAVDRQRLVALMLSGLTDKAIARQLGISGRTAQRRIAELIADLGVRTRFQAGVQAAFRDLDTPHLQAEDRDRGGVR